MESSHHLASVGYSSGMEQGGGGMASSTGLIGTDGSGSSGGGGFTLHATSSSSTSSTSSSSSSSSSSHQQQQQPTTTTVIASSPRVLYWGSGSPPAWRVLITLHEKRLSYRSEMITFESGVLKTAPMLSLNPRGLVPIFIDGEVRMYESLAIMHYLDDFYTDVPLLPRERVARARALARMQEANNVSAAAGEVVYYVRRTHPDEINEEYLSAKKAALHTELRLWEMYLVGSDYLAGSGYEPTLADMSFFPNLAYMVRLGLRLEGGAYPNLYAFFNRMCSRPSVAATWPPHWKTTPGFPILSD